MSKKTGNINNINNIINIQEAEFYNGSTLFNPRIGESKISPRFSIDNIINIIKNAGNITKIKTSLFITTSTESVNRNSIPYEYSIVEENVKFFFTIGKWNFTADDTKIWQILYKLAKISQHEFVCFFMELKLVNVPEPVNVILWTFGWGYCSGPNCKKIQIERSILPGTNYVGEFTFPDKYTSTICLNPLPLTDTTIQENNWDMNFNNKSPLTSPEHLDNVVIFLEKIIKCNFYINGDVREELNRKHMEQHKINSRYLQNISYASGPLDKVYYFRPSALKYNILRHICPLHSGDTAACIHIPKTIIKYIKNLNKPTTPTLSSVSKSKKRFSISLPSQKRKNNLLKILDDLYYGECRPPPKPTFGHLKKKKN